MYELYNEDCLKCMKNIPDKSIDLILCDLPYGITACSWDSVIPLNELWEQYKRVLKVNGVAVLFGNQPFTTSLISSNIKDFNHIWYWKKNNVTGGLFAKIQPMRCIEDICVFVCNRKSRYTYNPQGVRLRDKPRIKNNNGKSRVYRELPKIHKQIYTGYPKNLLEIRNVNPSGKGRYHPTQKPVELLEYLIKTYSNEGEMVLDNCMGSGSTGVACLNTNRNFIGIELDKKYFDIACTRLGEHKDLCAG